MAVLSRQNFNLKLLFFEERGRPENPANNLSGAKEITNNKLNPHMASTPGVEPRPHWREVSALTTAQGHPTAIFGKISVRRTI